MDETKTALINYFTKGLKQSQRQEVFNALKEITNDLDMECILDYENDYQNTLRARNWNDENINYFLLECEDEFKEVNKIMAKYGRAPLFKNPSTLIENALWRNKLVSILPLSECNKILGCSSYEEFEPPLLED